MRHSSITLALAGSLGFAAFLAACGGSTPNSEVPHAPSASAPASHAPPPATTTPPPATTTAPPATSSAPPPPPPKASIPELKPSTMADDLKGIGLDINNLPKMAKLTAAQRSKVMPFLKKATGFDCKDCHDGDKDFKKKTALKDVSEKMWDDYVVSHKLANGPLFCDSCHQGTHGYLTRKDNEAVKAYMDKELTKKLLAKKDGKEINCATCHTDTFEVNIFEKVWKIKGAPHAMIVPTEVERFVVGMK